MSDDSATWWMCGVFGAAFLALPFYRTADVRAWLLGPGVVPGWAGMALSCLCLVLAMWSLRRKTFAWAEPAWLTWSDFGGARRRLLGGRLLTAWGWRFGAAAYVSVVAGLLIGWYQPALVAAAFAVAAFGSLIDARPALRTGRALLVQRFHERMVRRTALVFLDPWGLLPPGRPVRWRAAFTGRAITVRFVLAGMLSRRGSLPTVVFLLAGVALAHALFPAVDAAWWIGLGGYCAALPFASSLAQLTRVPGLRRWIASSDRKVHGAYAGLLTAFIAVSTGVLVLLGVPLSVAGVVAVPVAAVAVVRTVTRSALDYGNLVVVSVAGVLVPMGLILQIVHGPDLLLVCVLLLVSGVVVATPVSLGLSAAALLSSSWRVR